MLSPPKFYFLATMKKPQQQKTKIHCFATELIFYQKKIFFCDKIDKISKGYDDQSYSPSIRSTMTMSKNCRKLKIFHISDMSK